MRGMAIILGGVAIGVALSSGCSSAPPAHTSTNRAADQSEGGACQADGTSCKSDSDCCAGLCEAGVCGMLTWGSDGGTQGATQGATQAATQGMQGAPTQGAPTQGALTQGAVQGAPTQGATQGVTQGNGTQGGFQSQGFAHRNARVPVTKQNTWIRLYDWISGRRR